MFRGRTYVEQPDANNRSGASFIRQNFDRNTITFSLESFGLGRTKKDLFKDNKMMLNVQQLERTTDSLHSRLFTERKLLVRQLNPYYSFLRLDTTGQVAMQKVANWKVPTRRLGVVNGLITQQAANRARNVHSYLGTSADRLSNMTKETANFRIEIYRKFTQSAAILLMFVIGAPLGAIIKKGGLGVPILISIVFFIVYYVISIMGEKYGREVIMPVGLGMWMATVILLPVGLYFLYQARHDSGILDIDWQRFRPTWLRWPLRGYKRTV
nr:LptF/LptG family permease [Hymenobacter sp. 5414T-23]